MHRTVLYKEGASVFTVDRLGLSSSIDAKDQTLISSARHVVYTRMVLDSDDPCSMLHPIDKKLPTYILFPPSFYCQSKTN